MIPEMTTRLHPGPYASGRLRNRLQCPSVKGRQEWTGKDRESKRGFLGMSFQPSPRASCTSVGVEDKDRDKSKPNGAEISMMPRTPMAEKVQDRALMERGWPGCIIERQTASVSKHGNGANPHFRKNSVPLEPNNSEEHKSHDSSSRTGEDSCLLPYSDDQSTVHRHRSIGRIHSCDGW